MAAPQQDQAKPTPKTRAKPKWIVYAAPDDGSLRPHGEYEARNADAACWQAAEGSMRDVATTEDGVRLVAIRKTEVDAKVYRLRSTVERVKA